MNLNDFAKDVHQNAVEHGWWDEARTFGEIVALCHSELSEALEELRSGRPMVYGDDLFPAHRYTDMADIVDRGLKPEGIAVELADCVIRILDWLGKVEIDADELVTEAMNYGMCDVPVPACAGSIGDHIARWHLLLSLSFACYCRASGMYASALRLGLCIGEIFSWADKNAVDMERILAVKHAYNQGRPYRHGGKVL